MATNRRNQAFCDMSEEQIEFLVSALIASARWYALLEEKRKEDQEHAVTLLNLAEDLRSKSLH